MTEKYLYQTQKTNQSELNVWCCFPAVYNFGMSALGYLAVYKYIDSIDGICAERIFTDTQNTQIQVKDVDVISFSFSFELDYLGILSILDKYKIPFSAKERDENHPLIYGGGPVLSANPEPFADYFDFIMIGDAETHISEVFETLKRNKGKTKTEKLELLSKIEGVYVPVLNNGGEKVKKVTANLCECASTPILTEKSFFPNTYIIEIERGCTQDCAFCLTSYINNPVRFNKYEDIISKIDEGLKNTNKLALLGAIICAHPQIDDICQYIIDKSEVIPNLEVTVSSLRADYVSDKILEMLHKCGQKTATIAVEAGSERLRKVINKRLTEEEIFNAIEKMVTHGFSGIKIYGMIGLPTETYEDLDAFIDLCRQIKTKYKGFIITPSFSCFTAKAQTPFQFAPRESIKSLEKKNEYLKKQFAKIGIKARTSSAKWDYIQALLSRSGRELTPYLTKVYCQGGSIGAFKSVQKEMYAQNLISDLDVIAESEFDTNKKLPWDFIEYPKTKDYLIAEYKRLLGR